MLYINWILLCFAALAELFHQHFQRMGIKLALICGFLLLQAIVLVTTTSLNVLTYFGSNLNFQGLSLAVALDQVGLHLSFGILLGMFCFRYLYLREQWRSSSTVNYMHGFRPCRPGFIRIFCLIVSIA